MDDYIENEILKLIRDKSLTQEELEKELSQYHESDIADSIALLEEDERNEILKRLSKDELADIIPFFENPEEYIEELPASTAADIVELMDADDAVDVLENVDEEKVEDILHEMERESREDVDLIRQYDEDEVGSKLTTNFIVVSKNSTIKQAMKTLVEEAPENDNIANIFVLDDENKYYGTIILKDLIIARASDTLEDITKTSYPTLYATEKIDEVINEIKDIDLELIPVLDENDKIIGVITSADIIETVDEELGEDYAKFAGLIEEEELDESFLKSVKKRIPWLSLLLCMDIITSTVLSNFSAVIAAMPVLVLFQSLVLDTSGNAGTQSLAVTIRSITSDQITKKNVWRNLLKEFLTGLVDGLFAGVVSFGITLLFLVISKSPVKSDTVIFAEQLRASLTIGIALSLAIPLSTLAGMLFPMFFKKIHVDPAVASGPLITTLSDVCGVSIYYGLAILMFSLVV